MTTTDAGPPAYERRGLILGIVLVGEFMVILDATIVTVALPSIQSGLGFHTQLDLQWVINAYILSFGGFLMLGGRAGDLFGRQRLFVSGLALFAGASLFNRLAQSPGMLIAGRAAQGLGGALVAPSVLSIIVATFSEDSARTRALGFLLADAHIQGRGERRVQQRACILLTQTLDHQLGQALKLDARLARREHQPHGLGLQAARDESKCQRGGAVEPLLIVHHADHRLLLGHLGEQAEDRQRHQESVRRGPRTHAEGRPQRLTLRRGQLL
jgi:hypothetical protein